MSRPDKPAFATRQSRLGDPEAARERLEAIRWPEGPVCPHCGSTGEAYKLEPRPESRRPVRPGVYKCAACRKQFTVTVGTIFEGSKVGLDKWLYAIHLMCASEEGISAHQLHREIDVQYKTAWLICRRIREAIDKEPLKPAEPRVSLLPSSFEVAVATLLKVKPTMNAQRATTTPSTRSES